MRVPNVLQGGGVLGELGRIRSNLNRAARELSTGKRVNRPSDDPTSAAKAVGHRDRAVTLNTYQNATDHAESKLVSVDNTLDTLERLMDAAASAAAAGRSGSTRPEAFGALAAEVDGIRQEVLRLANSRHGGTFVFAGRQTLSPAFTEAGGVVTYQGDDTPPQVRVDDNTIIETSLPGSGLFVGSLDAFQVLSDLRDALAAGDTTAAATEAANLEQVSDRFTQFRTRVGVTLQRLDRQKVLLRSVGDLERTELSREVDADLARSISALSANTTALEAALGAGGRVLSASLLDVLG